MKVKAIRFLSLVMVLTLCVPVFASSGSQYEQKIGFWDWVTDKNSILPDFIGYMAGTICPKSDDGYHHANSYQIDQQNGYYDCICSYCGKKFEAYESDLQQSYNDYVGTLPATGYNSDGRLIIYAQHKYFVVDNKYAFYCHHDERYSKNLNSIATFTYDCDLMYCSMYPASGGSTCEFFRIYNILELIAPVTGTYEVIPSYAAQVHVAYPDGFVYSGTVKERQVTSKFYTAGSSIDPYDGVISTDWGMSSADWAKPVSYGTIQFFPYGFFVTPAEFIDSSVYNITTRPTTITGGNYGIVGDNGQITKVTNNTSIINEINNTYYNPATGKTETVNSWSYDYSDRSYNITLESGDTVTVTYGDENITIIEGDTVYNIYYIIDGSGSDPAPGPSGSGHVHQWYQTGAVQGNCVTATQRTYTCSECGQQYTETDPAPGHTWHIIQEVSTKYDDSGKLIQEGYTIYECERCGEQYKSTNDAGPPPSGGGSSGGNSGSGGGSNIFSGIFGIIWDFFTFFFDFFSDFIVGGIKGFISALLDVGSDFFAILNPFDWGY